MRVRDMGQHQGPANPEARGTQHPCAFGQGGSRRHHVIDQHDAAAPGWAPPQPETPPDRTSAMPTIPALLRWATHQPTPGRQPPVRPYARPHTCKEFLHRHESSPGHGARGRRHRDQVDRVGQARHEPVHSRHHPLQQSPAVLRLGRKDRRGHDTPIASGRDHRCAFVRGEHVQLREVVHHAGMHQGCGERGVARWAPGLARAPAPRTVGGEHGEAELRHRGTEPANALGEPHGVGQCGGSLSARRQRAASCAHAQGFCSDAAACGRDRHSGCGRHTVTQPR